jgi:ABC-type antimicrobial peptide transport system permease subunit
LSHKQLRSHVADRLRAAILDGELKPGDLLRQERLAQEIGVSQMPVREALKELAAEGLVEHVPYRGARVVKFSAEDIADIYAHPAFLEGRSASLRRVLFLHILPNVASPIIVAGTLGLAGAIISESGLSYLGFGVQLPTPTWGNMLSNTQNQMTTAPWTAIFPGLAIFIVVLAINYLGDGLRDALDPRHHQSSE